VVDAGRNLQRLDPRGDPGYGSTRDSSASYDTEGTRDAGSHSRLGRGEASRRLWSHVLTERFGLASALPDEERSSFDRQGTGTFPLSGILTGAVSASRRALGRPVRQIANA